MVSYLAAAGVGHLTLVDDDVVETSNLPRQIIHTEEWLGRLKVDSAKDAVMRRDPGVRVDAQPARLDVEGVLALVAHADVVVDCTDSVDARYLLNDACVLLGVPFVWASIAQFAGQFGVVEPGVGACYRCVFPDAAASTGAMTCEAGGVLGVLPGVLGTLQAVEVMKIVAGMGAVATDAVRFYDALTATMTALPVARDDRCIACGQGRFFTGPETNEAGAEVSWEVLREESAGQGTTREGERVVVDVRESEEVALTPLPVWLHASVLHRPWGEGWSSSDVDEVVGVVGSREVAVVCARGMRSAAAANALRDAGMAAASVTGGTAGLDDMGEGLFSDDGGDAGGDEERADRGGVTDGA